MSLTILAITLYFLEFFHLTGFLNMLNNISDLVFEITIGRTDGKGKTKLRILTFFKMKNCKTEKRIERCSQNLKKFKIGKILLEKKRCKEKMVRLTDQLTATG